MCVEKCVYNDCAVLIVSCDKNKGVLDIFFDFFKKNWHDCPFDIYLGMEKLNLSYENIHSLCSGKDSFAGRLKEYLKYIGRKYVLIILDDFILEEKVYNIDIQYYYKLISSDDKIANISLVWIDEKSEKYCDKVLRKERNTNNLLNLQVAFWNAELLNNLLKDGENAWQTELYGSIRARKYKQYAFCNLEKEIALPYLYNGGWLVVKGAWNGAELKRLHLEPYASAFLDGKKILYSDFGRIPKSQSIKLRMGIIFRKLFSKVHIYF